jgi:hypothetical protein
MSQFDLARAESVLRSKYKAKWIGVYSTHNCLEAEIGLSLSNEILLIEISVNDAGAKPIEVDAIVIQPDNSLSFQNKTSSYATRPELVDYMKRIEHDIYLP